MSSPFSNKAAGAKAVRQWFCNFCHHVHDHKIRSCDACGGQDIFYFQSKSELARWRELKLLEQNHHIEDLRRQVKVPFSVEDRAILTPTGRIMRHEIDFSYVQDGERVFEDIKGLDTDYAYLKREIVRFLTGIEIVINTGKRKQ